MKASIFADDEPRIPVPAAFVTMRSGKLVGLEEFTNDELEVFIAKVSESLRVEARRRARTRPEKAVAP